MPAHIKNSSAFALILAASLMLLLTCDDTPTSYSVNPPNTSDTSVTKTISVSVKWPDPHFSLGQMIVSRTVTSSQDAYWIVPVTNTGSQTCCFINIKTVYFKNGFGTVVDSQKINYVAGGVLKIVATGDFSNAGLQPSETGYVVGLQQNFPGNNLYSAISSAVVDSFDYSVQSTQLPKADIAGVSFSLTGNNLSVTVKNDGAATAQFTDVPTIAIAWDGNKSPVMWTMLTPPVNVRLTPGDSCALIDNQFYCAAQVQDFLLFPDFIDYGVHHSFSVNKISMTAVYAAPVEKVIRNLDARRLYLERARQAVRTN